MSNPKPDPIVIEKTDVAIIARPQNQMIDDEELKDLANVLDQSAGPGSGIELIVLDLSRVQMIPSLALGLFVHLSKACKSRQQKLKLAALQPEVRQFFAITRLDRVFDLCPTVEAALQ
jgi:anti-anti-sigma factor